MKRLLAMALCLALLLTFAAGCASAGKTDGEAAGDTPGITADAPAEGEAAEGAPAEGKAAEAPEVGESAASEPPAAGESFVFRPKVASVFQKEIFGETMVETWYRLVDAVLAGEDAFACPDQWTYDWVMGQFPDRCFPVLTELVEASYEPVENGVAHIVYKTSREEFETKLAAFETLVEGILNEAMEPGDSDMEKALSLYAYFAGHYRYDYDTYERMLDEYIEDITTCRFLTGGVGICQEISNAYSYLLMQAGVDATIVMGETKSSIHQWSYVRINGHNYHIDPTYVLESPVDLGYFMMTDEKRGLDYPPEGFVVASAFTQEYGAPDYTADDDTFAPLWYTYLESLDRDSHTIHYISFSDFDGPVHGEFDYGGF